MTASGRDAPVVDSRRFDPALAGLVAATVAAFLAVFWREGLSLTPDSISYFSAAENFGHGRGFTEFDGRPLTRWPPLYPALLALFQPALTTMHAAVAVNAAALAGAMVAAYLFLRPALGRAAGLSAAVVAGPALVFFCAGTAGTESLFIFFVAAAFAGLRSFRETGRGLWPAAALAALAAITRYPGAALIATGVIVVLGRGGAWPRRLLSVAVFGVISVLPLAGWLGRNLTISGTPTGTRWPTEMTLSGAVREAAMAVGGWAPVAPPLLVLAVFVALTVASAVALARGDERARRLGWMLAVFGAAYGALLVWSRASMEMDPIRDRLIAPLLLPLFLFWVAGASCLPRLRPGRAMAIVAAALLLVLPLGLSLKSVKSAATVARRGPAGFNSREFRSSRLNSWLNIYTSGEREARDPFDWLGSPFLPATPVFSNLPTALWWHTGLVAGMSPVRGRPGQAAGTLDDPNWREWSGPRLIILFSRGQPRFLTAAELARVFNLTELAKFPNGAAYLAFSRAAP